MYAKYNSKSFYERSLFIIIVWLDWTQIKDTFCYLTIKCKKKVQQLQKKRKNYVENILKMPTSKTIEDDGADDDAAAANDEE